MIVLEKLIEQPECDAWSKVYKGFILFIAIAPNLQILASITIGKLEISLPPIQDEYWLIKFDYENQLLD